MARNFTFLRSKKFWILSIIGFTAVFGILIFQVQKSQKHVSFPSTDKSDSVPPVSQIIQPHENAVVGSNFFVAVRDVDAGSSGIAKDQCRYSIYDCGFFPCVQTVSNVQRVCSGSFLVSVGDGKACPTQGRDSCRVIVKSQDLVGNQNMESEAQESIKTLGIDFVSPNVIMNQPLLERTDLRISFEASVTDNIEVSNCDITIGKEGNYDLAPLQFSARSCTGEDEKACYQVSGSHIFSVSGMYEFSLSCWDLAGNTGKSEAYKVEAIQNRSPQISSCRVTPALGTVTTTFLFQGEASDPDGDAIAYEWKFGDGTTVSGSVASHQYRTPGVYTPQVTVTDSYGAEERCSTAWVVVAVGEIKQ